MIKNSNHTIEAKMKNRNAHLHKIPANKGKTLIEQFGEQKAKEIKQKQSESHKGRVGSNNGRLFSKEWCKKISESNTGKVHSKESCEKQGRSHSFFYNSDRGIIEKQKKSIFMCNVIQKGIFKQNSTYKHGYFFSKLNNKKFWYRSSLELKAYEFLDDEDSKLIIKFWDTECIRIPYIDENGQQRNTVPDIYVEYKSGKKQIINVKPFKRLKEIRNVLKHQACDKYAQENNMVHSIWTERELKK